MTVFATRSFAFAFPGIQGTYLADADFVTKAYEGQCKFCSCTRDIQVVYCRANLYRKEGGIVTYNRHVGKAFYGSFPQGIPFCFEHISTVLDAIRNGIEKMRIPDECATAA